MSPKETETVGAATGGVYDVKESGVHFRHMPAPATPKSGQEFLERVRNDLEINVLERPNENELVFELKGVDVSFANALRRIMIAEVPTVAIEHVYMWNNTSIVHDEVLAHRIGLVPLKIDARYFDDFFDEDDEPTDRNTVVFRLNVECRLPDKKSNANSRDATDSSSRNNNNDGVKDEKDSVLGQDNMDTAAAESTVLYRATNPNSHQNNNATDNNRPYTKHVYSSDLEWIPQGDQEQTVEGGILRPVHEDILLAKLRPGQTIELEAHGRRSIGKDHAKYSPVATASYRLMPHVELIKPVYDELAEELANLYEPGVFDLVPCTEEDEDGHTCKAVVVNPYASTMSRNYMRNEYLKEAVKVSRIPNHFIFNIESVGMMPPAIILSEALKILMQKCQNIIRLADESLEAELIHE